MLIFIIRIHHTNSTLLSVIAHGAIALIFQLHAVCIKGPGPNRGLADVYTHTLPKNKNREPGKVGQTAEEVMNEEGRRTGGSGRG